MQQPRLFLFIGYPGAGKTSIAQMIEEQTGATHIWADSERHKRYGSPTHSHEESTALYEELNQYTAELLKQGKSVIFDTNFNYFKDRQKLREIADQQGAQTVIVWVTTPYALAKERAVHSQMIRNGYDSTMDEAQFEAIATKLEKPRKSETVLRIDGTNVDAAQINQLLQL